MKLGLKTPRFNPRLVDTVPGEQIRNENASARRYFEEGSIRTSVEIHQLLCNFEEALGTKNKPSTSGSGTQCNKENGGERRRPYLQYFQRCVSKVIQHNKTWVLQLAVQRMVMSMIWNWDSQTAAPRKTAGRSREEILQGVQDETNFWENIAMAHRHTNKLVMAKRSERSTSRSCSPLESPVERAQCSEAAEEDNKRSFPTLSKYSPRSWPTDVRSAGGIKSRPNTKEHFSQGLGSYRNYADMLLAEQERESAVQQLTCQRIHRASSTRGSRIKVGDTLGFVPEDAVPARGPLPLGRLGTSRSRGTSRGSRVSTARTSFQMLPEIRANGASLSQEALPRDGSPVTSRNSSRGHSRCHSRGPSRGQSRGTSRGSRQRHSRGHSRDRSRDRNLATSRVQSQERNRGSGQGSRYNALDSPGLLPPLPLATAHSSFGDFGQHPSLTSRSAPPTYADHSASPRSPAAGGPSRQRRAAKTDSIWHGVGARGSPRNTKMCKRPLPLFERLPQLARLEGNPLRRPGQAQVLSEVVEDRIIVEFDGDLAAARPEENEARPEVQYFRACKSLGILPAKFDYFTNLEGMNQLNLAAFRLTDDQLRAVIGAVAQQPMELRLLDISNNRLLTDAALQSTMVQLGEQCLALKTLRLGDTQLGTGGIEVLANAMVSSLQLYELSMHGVPLMDQAWSLLVKGLAGSHNIMVLDLSDTQCGRWRQLPCSQLAHIMKDLTTLKVLDLSSNYFRRQGLSALGSFLCSPRCRVQTLMLDDNACSESTDASTADGAGGNECHPMVTFCEDVRLNRSLRILSLCDSQVDVTAAHCLEDAVVNHPALQELRVSGNPFGEAGVRAVLRGLLRERSQLVRLNFFDFGKAQFAPPVTFNYGDLTENYTRESALHMQHPYHRAILRLILWRTRDFGQPAEACMHKCQLDGHVYEKLPFKLDSAGHWRVPATGILQFTYALGLPLTCADSAERFVMKWQQVRRLPVAVTKFMVLQRVFADLRTDYERRTLLDAIAKECLLKHAQVKILTEDVICYLPDFAPSVISNLVLTTSFINRPCVNSTLLPCHEFYTGDVAADNQADIEQRHMNEKRRRRALRSMTKLMQMNFNNTNGHYELNLEEPLDYAMVERLFLIGSWEAESARQRGLPDTSQGGNFHAIRNLRLNGELQDVSSSWLLPGDGYRGEGVLHFDYASLLVPLATELPLDKDTFARLLSLVRREFTDACETAVLIALTHISHLMVLSASQLAHVLQVFEAGFQRINLFCELIRRCCDIGPPIVDHHSGVLGDMPGHGLFSWSERRLISERIGVLKTLDWLNIHLGDTAQVSRSKTLKQGAAAQRAAMQMLAEGDLPSTKGEAFTRPRRAIVEVAGVKQAIDWPKNRYLMNLSHNDDHRLATMLLELGDIEAGMNLVNTYWSECSNKTSGDWLVPNTWKQAVPREGMFQATYVLEEETSKDLQARKKCGRRSGWLVDAVSC